MSKHDELQQIIAPIVEAMGVSFVGIEYLPQGKHAVIRVYVESDKGVSIEQCGEVSREIGRVLDVEWQTRSPYYLEVSSPGLDRRLFTLEQCRDFIGKKLQVKLHKPVSDQRQFVGELNRVEENSLYINVENENYAIAFDNTSRVNLYVDWNAVMQANTRA